MASRAIRDRNPANAQQLLYQSTQKKLDQRRNAGTQAPANPETGKPGTNISRIAEKLKEFPCKDILPEGGEATLAVGLLDGKTLIVCNKGVLAAEGELISNRVFAKLRELVPEAQYEAVQGTIPSGLHAEMAIIRHLLQKEGGNPKDNLAGYKDRLQIICLGKGVCPDCAGFMNKRQIPHFSIQPAGGTEIAVHTEAGEASKYWIHPRTEAVFEASIKKGVSTLHAYNKDGTSVTSSAR